MKRQVPVAREIPNTPYLNGFAHGRTHIGQSPPPSTTSYFDFAVAERPMYIPGSGPPLAKPTLLPVHDLTGIILDIITLDGGDHRYMVTFSDEPSLKMSVKMKNIRNYVSARTLEDWSFNRLKEEEMRIKKAGLHWKVRQQMERESREQIGVGGLKRKRSPGSLEPDELGLDDSRILPGIGMVKKSPSGPGRRRVSESQVNITVSQSSPTAKRQRGLADTSRFESEELDDDSNTEMALAQQFNKGYGAGAQDFPRSTSASLEPSTTLPSLKQVNSTFQSRLRQSSRATSSSSASPVPNSKNRRASTPPRKATQAPKTSQTKLNRFFLSGQTLKSKSYVPKKRSPSPVSTSAAEEEESSGENYNIDRIVRDEVREDKNGNTMTWYLIKWEGDWPDSWEPATNVGEDARKEYKKVKKMMKNAEREIKRMATRDDDELHSPAKVNGKSRTSPDFGMGDVQMPDARRSNTPSEDGLFIARTSTTNTAKLPNKSTTPRAPPIELSSGSSSPNPQPVNGGEIVVISSDEESEEDEDELA